MSENNNSEFIHPLTMGFADEDAMKNYITGQAYVAHGAQLMATGQRMILESMMATVPFESESAIDPANDLQSTISQANLVKDIQTAVNNQMSAKKRTRKSVGPHKTTGYIEFLSSERAKMPEGEKGGREFVSTNAAKWNAMLDTERAIYIRRAAEINEAKAAAAAAATTEDPATKKAKVDVADNGVAKASKAKKEKSDVALPTPVATAAPPTPVIEPATTPVAAATPPVMEGEKKKKKKKKHKDGMPAVVAAE
jgi:hypothetical protein